MATFADGTCQHLHALVDTGAEVSLINPKWVNPSLFTPSPKPIRLGVANSHLLEGGKRQASMTLTFFGRDMDTGHRTDLAIPFTAYDADVVCDIILSYGWLASNNILPNPRRHGLHFLDSSGPIWVNGIITPKPSQITVLESLPITTFPIQSTDTQPNMDETQYIQLVQSWEHSENLNTLSKRLHSLLLTPTPHHPLFALPDYPGLGEENHIDFLDDADINELAQDIQFAPKNILTSKDL